MKWIVAIVVILFFVGCEDGKVSSVKSLGSSKGVKLQNISVTLPSQVRVEKVGESKNTTIFSSGEHQELAGFLYQKRFSIRSRNLKDIQVLAREADSKLQNNFTIFSKTVTREGVGKHEHGYMTIEYDITSDTKIKPMDLSNKILALIASSSAKTNAIAQTTAPKSTRFNVTLQLQEYFIPKTSQVSVLYTVTVVPSQLSPQFEETITQINELDNISYDNEENSNTKPYDIPTTQGIVNAEDYLSNVMIYDTDNTFDTFEDSTTQFGIDDEFEDEDEFISTIYISDDYNDNTYTTDTPTSDYTNVTDANSFDDFDINDIIGIDTTYGSEDDSYYSNYNEYNTDAVAGIEEWDDNRNINSVTDEEIINEGRNYYLQYCAKCHGEGARKQAYGVAQYIYIASKDELRSILDSYRLGDRDIYGYGDVMTKELEDISYYILETIIDYLNSL